MSIKIAVLSGKGGTGKTTISVNLSHVLSEKYSVQLLDADVEEPDSHLFFDYREGSEEKTVFQMIPEVDNEKCIKCGACSRECQFGAINIFTSGAMVFKNLCHGCGVCSMVCPAEAIKEIPKELGKLQFRTSEEGIDFGEGILKVGEISGVKVIRSLKENMGDNEIIILDSPPGSSCPVVETLRGVDFALLVTEDSAFGLHDMEIVSKVLDEMGIPFGIILNKYREHSAEEKHSKEFKAKFEDKLFMKIPLDKKLAGIHSEGRLFVKEYEAYKDKFLAMFDQIKELVG